MNYYGSSFWAPTDLAHYGVIGMKWGVRRYQNKDGSLTPAGKRRKNASDPIHKEAIRAINRERRAHRAGAIGGLLSASGLLMLQTPITVPLAAFSGGVSLVNTVLAGMDTHRINDILNTPISEIYLEDE